MKKEIAGTVGWVGVLVMIGTYVLYTFQILPANELWFNLLNAISAALIALYAFDKRAWPIVLLMLAWGALALYSVYVYL